MSPRPLFAVVGRPIAHSLSPELMNGLLHRHGVSGTYTRIATDTAIEALELMEQLDMRGINVTAPFKQDMLQLVQASESAVSAGAVNTVIRTERGFKGHNTDLLGLQELLRDFNGPALVLGSGGAARAVLAALNGLGIPFSIAARNAQVRTELAEEFGGSHHDLDSLPELLKGHPLVISTLPGEVCNALPWELNDSHTLIDASYVNSEMEERVARARGRYLNGKHWLRAQAAPGFQLFTGHSVDFESIIIPTREHTPESIVLTGFMGSGKSTVGARLAESLDMGFVDLDSRIEQETGLSILQIFEEKGEEYFRELETLTMEKTLDEGAAVISTGGGFPTREVNRDLLQDKCWTVWLYSTMEDTLPRLGSSRPLANDKSPAELETLFTQRKDAYAMTADLLIWNKQDLDKVVERLIYEARIALSLGASS